MALSEALCGTMCDNVRYLMWLCISLYVALYVCLFMALCVPFYPHVTPPALIAGSLHVTVNPP